MIERISVAWDGAEANGESIITAGSTATIGDGRYVVFESTASNLVADDFNGWSDVFVAYDRATLLADGFESGDHSAWSSVVP